MLPRFALVAIPATEAASFRSDNFSDVVSPREVVLRCLIDDLYGESCCALVLGGTNWYHSVPNLNSYKFNEISRCFVQLNAQFASSHMPIGIKLILYI
jgi:hypothetical protein